MLNLLHMIDSQERELCVGDSMKYTFNIGLCSDTYERILSNLVILVTTKVCMLILVWMTVTFAQGHTAARKLELVGTFCSIVA